MCRVFICLLLGLFCFVIIVEIFKGLIDAQFKFYLVDLNKIFGKQNNLENVIDL